MTAGNNEYHVPELSGCGRPETVREVSDLVRLRRPSLVFLSETKMSDKRGQDLKWKLGFSNIFGVKAVGLSGVLCLYWNNDSRVTLKSSSNSHIDVLIQNEELGVSGGLLAFMVIQKGLVGNSVGSC